MRGDRSRRDQRSRRSKIATFDQENAALLHRDEGAVTGNLVGDRVLEAAAESRIFERILASVDRNALDDLVGGEDREITIGGTRDQITR